MMWLFSVWRPMALRKADLSTSCSVCSIALAQTTLLVICSEAG